MPLTTPPAGPGFREAFSFWLKLGFISFGGPAGQISLMHHELVERRRWISEARFLHALNFCMMLPGPEAKQLAVYMGWLMHGIWGGLCAGLLFLLPSLVLLIGLSWVYAAWGELPAIEGLFHGIKPAVTAIVLHAAWRIGRRALKHWTLWSVAAAAFIAIFFLHAPFPYIVLGAALIGLLAARAHPAAFEAAMEPAGGGGQASLIDHDTPLPEHARFRGRRALRMLGLGLLAWALPLAGLAQVQGYGEGLAAMAWFFTKAAFLTFGGAYAVLPYVYQGAVEHYGWLSAQQMIDGLALGETTPGPLIMVVAFVGYLGGWNTTPLAMFAPSANGTVGALTAAWFTFLPSFLFIFLGAPAVEASRRNLHLHAPLRAITAAVVGVIFNLALFFAGHVWWPEGSAGPFDAFAAGLSLIAAMLLFRGTVGVVSLIGGCGLLGLSLACARSAWQ